MTYTLSINRVLLATLTSLLVGTSGQVTAEDTALYPLADGQMVATLEHFRECDHCPDMIVILLGSFMMGASEGESWSSLVRRHIKLDIRAA